MGTHEEPEQTSSAVQSWHPSMTQTLSTQTWFQEHQSQGSHAHQSLLQRLKETENHNGAASSSLKGPIAWKKMVPTSEATSEAAKV